MTPVVVGALVIAGVREVADKGEPWKHKETSKKQLFPPVLLSHVFAFLRMSETVLMMGYLPPPHLLKRSVIW